jgi:hypothetical protein
MFSFLFPPVSNFSVFFPCSLSFISFLFFFLFLLGGIYRGKRERDRPYPCPIVAHGEWGLPALSRRRARWPMASLAWHGPQVSHHEGAWVALGFGFWQSTQGERETWRNKEKKNLSSPVARLGEEEEGTVSLKTTLLSHVRDVAAIVHPQK